MTTALRFLAGLLGHLPTFAFVYAPIQHVGDVVQHGHVCEGDWESSEPNLELVPATVPVYPLPAPILRSLFEEVAIAKGNGCSVDEAADTGFATLLLSDIEATGPEA